MSILITILIAVLIFAIIIWILGMFPIDPRFKQIIYVILGLIFIIGLIKLVGWI